MPAVSGAGGVPARRTAQDLPCCVGVATHHSLERWVTPTPAQRPCDWHGRSRGSQGRSPTGANVEVGHSQIAGGSDQSVRGAVLTPAPHRHVSRTIMPVGVTVRLTHRPPQPNPSTTKRKKNPRSPPLSGQVAHTETLFARLGTSPGLDSMRLRAGLVTARVRYAGPTCLSVPHPGTDTLLQSS